MQFGCKKTSTTHAKLQVFLASKMQTQNNEGALAGTHMHLYEEKKKENMHIKQQSKVSKPGHKLINY